MLYLRFLFSSVSFEVIFPYSRWTTGNKNAINSVTLLITSEEI